MLLYVHIIHFFFNCTTLGGHRDWFPFHIVANNVTMFILTCGPLWVHMRIALSYITSSGYAGSWYIGYLIWMSATNFFYGMVSRPHIYKQCMGSYVAASLLTLVIIQLFGFLSYWWMISHFGLFFYLFYYLCVWASLCMLAICLEIPFLETACL